VGNPRSEWRTTRLRLAVAHRDQWVCYRWTTGEANCGGHIDPHLRYPHRMSVTLEHVLPPGVTLAAWVAQGHDPYDPNHCAVSHRTCNQSAGTRLRNLLAKNRRGSQRRTPTLYRTATEVACCLWCGAQLNRMQAKFCSVQCGATRRPQVMSPLYVLTARSRSRTSARPSRDSDATPVRVGMLKSLRPCSLQDPVSWALPPWRV
jgi:hypothetical protein